MASGALWVGVPLGTSGVPATLVPNWAPGVAFVTHWAPFGAVWVVILAPNTHTDLANGFWVAEVWKKGTSFSGLWMGPGALKKDPEAPKVHPMDDNVGVIGVLLGRENREVQLL